MATCAISDIEVWQYFCSTFIGFIDVMLVTWSNVIIHNCFYQQCVIVRFCTRECTDLVCHDIAGLSSLHFPADLVLRDQADLVLRD